MAESAIRQEPLYLGAAAARRFCIWRSPAAAPPRAVVVHLPAFAEEMNKCRRMTALGARALARAGFAVLQIDLEGCGDSAGAFGDATWKSWTQDVEAAVDHACARVDAPLWLWATRAGALLLAPALACAPAPAGILLWQPVLAGRTHLAQFLRLRTTAEMMSDGSARASVAVLRDRLQAGETLEVAGYGLNPGLAAGLESAELALPPGKVSRVIWLEVSGADAPALAPASASRIDALQSSGIDIDARVVTGPAFWQSVEIEECPALVDASMELIDTVPQPMP